MEQVQLFYGVNDPVGLQRLVNNWLKEKGDKIEITRATQSSSGRYDHHVTITIFYKVK